MRNVAIALKYSTNEERSYHPQVFDKRGTHLSPSSFQQMRNVAIALKSSKNEERSYINLKSSTNEERIYHPQVFDK